MCGNQQQGLKYAPDFLGPPPREKRLMGYFWVALARLGRAYRIHGVSAHACVVVCVARTMRAPTCRGHCILGASRQELAQYANPKKGHATSSTSADSAPGKMLVSTSGKEKKRKEKRTKTRKLPKGAPSTRRVWCILFLAHGQGKVCTTTTSGGVTR